MTNSKGDRSPALIDNMRWKVQLNYGGLFHVLGGQFFLLILLVGFGAALGGVDFLLELQLRERVVVLGVIGVVLIAWMSSLRIPWSISVHDGLVSFRGPFLSIESEIDNIKVTKRDGDEGKILLLADGKRIQVSRHMTGPGDFLDFLVTVPGETS
jgi:hypothetical protein